MLDAVTFRERLPEFSDVGRYTDPVVEIQLSVAYRMLNADRWAEMLDDGVAWCAAHMLVITAAAISASDAGKAVGGISGPQASKSVGGVSVSYATQAVTFADAPFWNQSTYGIQLLTMARMIGAGGLQL